ncbi:MAG TPA: peptidylprolyl isomerase [Allosphingosinicella sp.]|nr:peptidylprolyl isomerase [Allosphingosinicella sp.]
MNRPLALLAALALLAGCGEAPPARAPAAETKASMPAPRPVPDVARVRLETEAGAIVVELDGRHAPVTTANFLAYVDQHRFDGTSFYRASRTEGAPTRGFVQGGIRRDYRRMLAPIAHEPTSATGLRHRAGTISMARGETGAMGNFFITTASMPAMDARGREQGYAAFGRVVEGMDVVRHILAAPTDPRAGSGAMRGQMLAAPVRIVRASRVE